jgi:hypothetical protein
MPTFFRLRDSFCILKVDSENLRKLLHTKWSDCSDRTSQQTVSMISVRLLDFRQYMLISLVQGLWKFVEGTSDAWWKTMLNSSQLTKHPPKPV